MADSFESMDANLLAGLSGADGTFSSDLVDLSGNTAFDTMSGVLLLTFKFEARAATCDESFSTSAFPVVTDFVSGSVDVV